VSLAKKDVIIKDIHVRIIRKSSISKHSPLWFFHQLITSNQNFWITIQLASIWDSVCNKSQCMQRGEFMIFILWLIDWLTDWLIGTCWYKLHGIEYVKLCTYVQDWTLTRCILLMRSLTKCHFHITSYLTLIHVCVFWWLFNKWGHLMVHIIKSVHLISLRSRTYRCIWWNWPCQPASCNRTGFLAYISQQTAEVHMLGLCCRQHVCKWKHILICNYPTLYISFT